MLKLFHVILFILLMASQSWAGTYYVRPGATGTGSGLDWTNAYTEIPYSGNTAVLASRASSGHIYYLAAGTLSRSLYFGTALGATPYVIEFRKATIADHGTDVGWNAAYAGQTTITATWEFTTGYWYLNGVTGGGPGNWDGSSTPFGIKWLNDNCNGPTNQSLRTPALGRNFTVRHIHFYNPCVDYWTGIYGYLPDGGPLNGYGEQIMYGVGGATREPIIEYNMFEDSYGPPIYCTAFYEGKIRYNYFYGSRFTANWHSNSINSGGWMTDMEIAYNYFRDTDGGGVTHVIEAGLNQSDRRLHIYGNVFIHTDAPWTKSSHVDVSCIDCTFHNNTIYNCMGDGRVFNINGGTGNSAYNNIIHTCGLKYIDWTGISSHDYNYFYGCGTQTEANKQDGVPAVDLFVSPSTHNLALRIATNPGLTIADTSVSTYTKDIAGLTRGSGGWDRGAYEYTGVDTYPPTISNITSNAADGKYGIGSVIDIDVTFSEIVTSSGFVILTFDTGGSCQFTVTNSSFGTCNYTVLSGHNSSDLNVSSVSAPGGIRDAALIAMTNFTPSTNLSVNKTLNIDGNRPTVLSVNSNKANGSYGVGEVIDIDVTFNEAVTSGLVTVTLNTGRSCTFSIAAPGASFGTCNYTVQVGDVTADLDTSSISGTILDLANNSMTNYVPGITLAANKNIIITTLVPTAPVGVRIGN